MNDNASAKARLAKLLNMTTANGCSEDEQETALRMAASLAAKAGIDLEAARAATGAKPEKRKAARKRMHEKLKPHQAYCATAAAELMGIHCGVYDLGAHGIEFVGREELIDAATDLMMWLFRQVETLYKQALPRGLSQTARAEFRRTFKAACANRTLGRAREHMRELRKGQHAASIGHNAVVVVGYYETLKAELDEYFYGTPEERAARLARANAEHTKHLERMANDPAYKRDYERMLKSTPLRGDRRGRSMPTGSGTNAGFAAGERVKLRKEIG